MVAVGSALWLRGRTEPAFKTVNFVRLTDFAGLEESPALSPDGKSVAFVAIQRDRGEVWVRLLAGGPPLEITRDSGEHLDPAVVPGFFSGYLLHSPSERRRARRFVGGFSTGWYAPPAGLQYRWGKRESRRQETDIFSSQRKKDGACGFGPLRR